METQLLQRGLSFIPTPHNSDKLEFLRDIHRYNRSLKLIEHFHDRPGGPIPPFQGPSSWEPPLGVLSGNLTTLLHYNKHIAIHNHSTNILETPNITEQEYTALRHLRNYKHIVIKPADKGSKIVILDTQQYLLEAHRQLGNTLHYRPIQDSLQLATQHQIRNIFTDLHKRKYITHRQKIYLDGPDTQSPLQQMSL